MARATTNNAPAAPSPGATGAVVPSSELTQSEAEYVHNVEVLGLPAAKAASLAGLSMGMAVKPHIQQARELLRREIRGNMRLTKEDVLFGIHEAIDRARLGGEPATEIIGWKQISTMLGYDAPSKVDVSLRETVHVVQQHVRSMSNTALVEMLGAGNVVDGEFYPVGAE